MIEELEKMFCFCCAECCVTSYLHCGVAQAAPRVPGINAASDHAFLYNFRKSEQTDSATGVQQTRQVSKPDSFLLVLGQTRC